MLHFVVYHNREEMGKEAIPFQLETRKSTDNLMGNTVWCIEGVGKSPKEFFLAHVFIVDRIEPSNNPDFLWIAYGIAGCEFQQREKLNEFDWFLDLKKRLQFGLQPITEDKYILGLRSKAEREGCTLDALWV